MILDRQSLRLALEIAVQATDERGDPLPSRCYRVASESEGFVYVTLDPPDCECGDWILGGKGGERGEAAGMPCKHLLAAMLRENDPRVLRALTEGGL